MSWVPFAAVVIAGVFGGMLLVSRVGAWIVGLVLMLKSPSADGGNKVGFSFAQFFLHSGLWSLIIACGVIYYVASLPERMWLWALVTGLSLSVLILALAILTSRRARLTGGPAAQLPLTPDRLRKIRRRFFLGTTIYFGGGSLAAIFLALREAALDVGLILIMLPLCAGAGWLFSWFIWQWVGATLEAKEIARQRAQRVVQDSSKY